jgi:hypothetical protein
MRANLFIVDNNGTTLMDGNMTNYHNQYSNEVDGNDIWKMSNFGENFGIIRTSANLVNERRSLIAVNDTTYFRMWNMQLRNYRIQVITENLHLYNLTAFVKDLYLNQEIPIDLNDTTNIDFTVTSQPGSYASNRFKLIYTNTVTGPLPLLFTGIKAQCKNNAMSIEWSFDGENSIEHYILEHATDGVHFNELHQIMATKSSSKKTYFTKDQNAREGNHFYRVKAISPGAELQYSHIVKVAMDKRLLGIVIYPNPAVNKQMTFDFKNQLKGKYNIQLCDKMGQLVYSEPFLLTEENTHITIMPGANLKAGVYLLKVISSLGMMQTEQVLIL